MHTVFLRFSRLSSLVAIAAIGTSPLLPFTAIAAPPTESTASPSADDLIAQAEAKSDAGAHAEAAALYAESYRALPQEQQRGELGAFIVKNATQSYRRALEHPAEDLEQVRTQIVLLRAEAELLHEFTEHREPETVPASVAKTRDELGLRIRVLERQEAELVAQLPVPPEVARVSPLGDPPVLAAPPEPSPQEPEPSPPTPPSSALGENSTAPAHVPAPSPSEPLQRRKHTAAIIGVGVTTLVGSAATIGGGGWMFTDFIRRGNDMVQQYDDEVADAASSERTPAEIEADEAAQRQRLAEIERFREQSRRKATGVVAGGAALAAVGIGITAWGVARLRRSVKLARQDAVAGDPSRPDPEDGAGLVIATVVIGSLAWANATITRPMAMRFCIEDIDDDRDDQDDYSACATIHDATTGSLMAANWLLNGITYGLAPAAGEARGHHDAIMDAWKGGRRRNAPAFIGSGAALLVAGIGGRVTVIAALARGCTAHDAVACHRDVVLEILGSQLSSSAIATGAGLLRYGLAYRRSGKVVRQRSPVGRLRLIPQLGRVYAGLDLIGHF